MNGNGPGLNTQDSLIIDDDAALNVQPWAIAGKEASGRLPAYNIFLPYQLNHSFPIFMFTPFLKNPFASKQMSRADFRDLMQGHLRRLSSQNQDNRYSAMIASLQPHYDAYQALLGEQDQTLGARLGQTDTVEELLAEFKEFVKEELLVDVEYIFKRKKPNPEALTAFLPKGRTEYNNATLLTLPTLLQRVADLTRQYKADLGADLASRAADLQAALTTARATQTETQGAVQDDSREEKKLRKAAARQLKLNLLDQLKLHIDEPEAVQALYDARWFTKKREKAKPAPL